MPYETPDFFLLFLRGCHKVICLASILPDRIRKHTLCEAWNYPEERKKKQKKGEPPLLYKEIEELLQTLPQLFYRTSISVYDKKKHELYY